jgi:hypothetical protein
MTKQIPKIQRSSLTSRYYIVTKYRDLGNGVCESTGEKYDVTETIDAIFATKVAEVAAPRAELASLRDSKEPPSREEDDLITIAAICEALYRHGDYMEAANNVELAEVYDAAAEMIYRGTSLSPDDTKEGK